MPRRVHLLSPDHGGFPRRRHHTPPVTATQRHRRRLHRAGRATSARRRRFGTRPEPTFPLPETSICCVSSPTLSVDRPVVVMVTSDRRAIMIPVGPDLSTPATMSPVHLRATNTPSSVMIRKDRAGHRTVERVDEHASRGTTRAPEPVPEEERELREDHPGDEDRSANRPQSAQIVLQSAIESRSKLGTEWVMKIPPLLQLVHSNLSGSTLVALDALTRESAETTSIYSPSSVSGCRRLRLGR